MKRVFAVLAALICGAACAGAESVKVSSLGYDAADSTRFLQAALDSGARRVIVDRQAGPWVTRPLVVRSNTELVFEPGVVLLAKRGEFMGLRDYLVSVVNVTNVTLRGGAGSALRMWRDDYMKPPYPRGEWRYTLAIRAAKGVCVEDLRFEASGGDGICIAENSLDVTVRRCVCDRNLRQGLTIGSGENILVEDCVFSNTRGAFPQAGVDIEPDAANHGLVNVVLRSCLSCGNAGSGYEIAPNALTPRSRPVSITFENCRAVDNLRGVTFFGAWKKTSDFAQGRVCLKGCEISGSRHTGICIKTKPAEMLDLVFENCVVSDSASKGSMPDVEIGSGTLAQPPPDRLEFRNLRIRQKYDAPWFKYGDLGTGPRPSQIVGDVTVTRADGRVERIVLDEAWCARELAEFNAGRPFKALTRFDATSPVTVRDACPGVAVPLSPVASCFDVPFVFYMQSPGRAVFEARQVIAAAGRPPSTNAYEIVSLAEPSRRWRISPVSTNATPIVFDAPAGGFYRLAISSPGTRFQMLSTTVPVAVDLTQGERTFGSRDGVPFSVWFELPPAAPEKTVLLRGDSYYRFAAAFYAPDGTRTAAFDDVETPRTVSLSAAPRPGLWRCDVAPAKAPHYDWSRFHAAGAPDCLFLSPEKVWFRTQAAE